MLAALPPEQFEAFLHERELTAHTRTTITSIERLREEINEVRKNGVAYDDGEFDEELRCVAVPVMNFTGRVIGSLGVSGPALRLSIQNLQRQIGNARIIAERLSMELGYRPSSTLAP